MKRTLMLTGNVEEVWPMLGEENAGCFDDNGGDPDGPAWLPNSALDESDADVEDILAAGLGEMVTARYMSDDEVIAAFSAQVVLYPATDDDPDDFDEEALQNIVDDKTLWAHYGAYGAMDSRWVIVYPWKR